MKEYNWREERKKYLNNPSGDAAPVNPVMNNTAPQRSGGKALKIILSLFVVAILGGAGLYYFSRKSADIPQIPAPVVVNAVNLPVSAQQPVTNKLPAQKYVQPEITVHYKSGPADDDEYGVLDMFKSGKMERLKAPAVTDEELNNHKHKKALLQLKNNAVNTLKFFADTFNYRSYDNKNGPYKMYYTIKTCNIDQNGKRTVTSVNNAYEMASPIGNGRFDIFFAFSPENISQDTVTHEFTHAVTDYRINDGNRT